MNRSTAYKTNHSGIVQRRVFTSEFIDGIEKLKILKVTEHYVNGMLHREDGPAVEWTDGVKKWWINGEELIEEQFDQWYAKKELNERLQLTLPDKPADKKKKI